MPSSRYCHFCGRSDSLHPIPKTTKYVCSLCWDIVVHIVGQYILHEYTKEDGDISLNLGDETVRLFKQKDKQ